MPDKTMNPIKKTSTKKRWFVSRREFLRAGTLLGMNALALRQFELHGETFRDTTKDSLQQIAFLADVHFHDVYAIFEEGSFQGIKGADGRNATIRTMSAQLSSTRLFNENYFALKAALDSIVARNIKLVVLTGDFSDDGQPVHMRGLKRILDEYTLRNGIRFIATFGNHDPVKPFEQPHGKRDFLGEYGRQQAVLSQQTADMRALGYEGLLDYMGQFEPYPQKEDTYWESPFSTYSYTDYTFERARAEAGLENRMYEAYEGAIPSPDAPSIRIPDLSYLVEPVEGVWLLGIDANVFSLSPDVDFLHPEAPANFVAAGNAGWNRLVVEKKAVVTWIKNVVDRAAALNKRLIAFSHYPMLDTMRGAGPDIAAMFAAGRNQPTAETMREMAATGLRLHFGGHLHKNNTAVYTSEDAFLVDVQIPSIAAYMPAFKVLTLHPNDSAEIETITLDDVPGFDTFFDHYRVEHAHLAQSESPALWNARILESKNYRAYTQGHLMELTRRRYLPREWPKEIRESFGTMSGISLLTLLAFNTDARMQDLDTVADSESRLITKLSDGESEDIRLGKLITDWHAAEQVVIRELEKREIARESLSDINGLMIATDYYRLLGAGGSLAAEDIKPRVCFYNIARTLAKASSALSIEGIEPNPEDLMPVGMRFKRQFIHLLHIIDKLSGGLPNDHFKIDFKYRCVRMMHDGNNISDIMQLDI